MNAPDLEQPFGVAVAADDDGSARVVVTGEVDLHSAPALRQSLADASALGPGNVVVDLEAVSFLDSTGLNALLGARAALQREQRQLVVERAPARVLRVFEVAGVAELLGSDGHQ